MKKHMIIPIFIPHEGCPHDCVFCNQKKIAGQTEAITVEALRIHLDEWLSTRLDGQHIEIAFYGGSFTGIPLEDQKKYLDVAQEYVHRYDLDGIKMSTRPDMISPEIMEFLSDYSITTIELGVQSMCPEVLEASNRGHSVEDVYHACHLIRHYGFGLGLQMMLGLPEDTPERSLDTADKLIAIEPDVVRIYPTLVIKDTALEQLYIDGSYKPFDLETTIDLCAKLTERFEQAGIFILRIGLQGSDNIAEGADIVAGPWHPALGQLVMEKRWMDYLLDYLKDMEEPVTIRAGAKMYQTLVGHKKSHMAIWTEHEPAVTLIHEKDSKDMQLQVGTAFLHLHEQRVHR